VFIYVARRLQKARREQKALKKAKRTPEIVRFPVSSGGDCWTRTSDLLRVKKCRKADAGAAQIRNACTAKKRGHDTTSAAEDRPRDMSAALLRRL